MVKENSVCDSILLNESERLIRSQRFVREVSVTPIYFDSKSDSVDIKVRVLDSWSLIPKVDMMAQQMQQLQQQGGQSAQPMAQEAPMMQ